MFKIDEKFFAQIGPCQGIPIWALILSLVLPHPTLGIELENIQKPTHAFAIYVENDSRNIGGPGLDQDYTNGFKLSEIYAETQKPNWSKTEIERLSIIKPKFEEARVNYAFSVSQKIFSPNNTETNIYVSDDRPYASWLYLGFAVAYRDHEHGNFFEVDLGYVGPSSHGEQVQNNFHDWIHQPRAQGWNNGLSDEPTLESYFQQRTKSKLNKNLDFIPYFGNALGNVEISLHVGAWLRAGSHLPEDLGPSRPSAGDGDSFVSTKSSSKALITSFYTFAGTRLDLIGRSIFLDGNNFKAGPHVTRIPLNGTVEFGVGTQTNSFSLIWRYVTKSPEFEERKIYHSFAALTLVYFL